ncbi:MAG: 16S rRNA (guanine(527)-N(7))-methyltransferase RsmG, partial [Thermodesulfobacteriota bacterium]
MADGKKRRAPGGANEHTPQEMARLLARAGITLSGARLKQLWSYHCLLRKHNPELNLTRIHNFENMVLKLYVDSMLPGTLTDLPSPLLDLGTGPGMPGIPLKIAFPDLVVMLAEARGKRVTFLETAVRELGLSGATVIGRAITPDFQEPVAGIITRAVETISATLERVSGCLPLGGKVFFMKGPSCDEEIAGAKEKFDGRFRLAEDIAYRIADTAHRRRLVI